MAKGFRSRAQVREAKTNEYLKQMRLLLKRMQLEKANAKRIFLLGLEDSLMKIQQRDRRVHNETLKQSVREKLLAVERILNTTIARIQ